MPPPSGSWVKTVLPETKMRYEGVGICKNLGCGVVVPKQKANSHTYLLNYIKCDYNMIKCF